MITAARESRDSEKTLRKIWDMLPHLQVTVWKPFEDDAIELATDAMINLGKLISQLKEEKMTKDTSSWKHANVKPPKESE